MSKKKVTARVVSQKNIAPGIYDLWLETELAQDAGAGQFVGVFSSDKSTLLPRPISICEVSDDKSLLRLVYRIAGKGTAEFSKAEAGDEIKLLGVLGNGYDVKMLAEKKVMLMGGGIGVPPMLELAREIYNAKLENIANSAKANSGEANSVKTSSGEANQVAGPETEKAVKSEILIVMGYRDSQTFLKEDMEKYGTVYIASEDGSVGSKGNVMNAVADNELKADVICSCGPMPMLRAIKKYAAEQNIPAYISLEERMACGVGACLGCVVKTREVDHHSHVNNARICTDGPVFLAEDVDI